MARMTHTTREPIILMSKRGELLPVWKSWGIRVVGFLLSLLVSGGVIMRLER